MRTEKKEGLGFKTHTHTHTYEGSADTSLLQFFDIFHVNQICPEHSVKLHRMNVISQITSVCCTVLFAFLDSYSSKRLLFFSTALICVCFFFTPSFTCHFLISPASFRLTHILELHTDKSSKYVHTLTLPHSGLPFQIGKKKVWCW